MIIWIIAIALVVIIAILAAMIFLRKLHFDTIHRNLLDLEDKYGGKVIRGGFAIRPKYSGDYKGKKVSVTITYSKEKDGRKYYIELTMQAKSKLQFSILGPNLMEGQEIPPERKEKIITLGKDNYLLEVTDPSHIKSLNIKKISNIVTKMYPFVFILITKTGLMLERVSNDLINDTDIRQLGNLFKNLYELREALEQS
jgi:hypothetical protein